ncbi:MAG: DUF4755 domain-containing protein [Alphaproteobacteria bacterium]|nr:DUF4755 domain-containing protein [Alphaproteobacteria bacterium]
MLKSIGTWLVIVGATLFALVHFGFVRMDIGFDDIIFLVIVGGLGVGAVLFAGYRKTAIDAWAASWPTAPYKHLCDPQGIIVDPVKEMVHLRSVFFKKVIERSYPFADIRGWRYNLQKGGHVSSGSVIGGGITGASHNIGSAIGDLINNAQIENRNIQNTGFFIEVRDIEFPEWRIWFPGREKRQKYEMKKWMEIFNQHVNGEKPLSKSN